MTAKAKRRAITATIWTAVILSLYSSFVIFNTWFLVPYDPSQTQAHNIKVKLEIIAVFAAVLFALVTLARWAFKKRSQYRISN